MDRLTLKLLIHILLNFHAVFSNIIVPKGDIITIFFEGLACVYETHLNVDGICDAFTFVYCVCKYRMS